jgi:hypothetical protein
MQDKITILELLTQGFEWYKKHLTLLLGVGLTGFFSSLLLEMIQFKLPQASLTVQENPYPFAMYLVLFFLLGLFFVFLSMGLNTIYLKISKEESFKYTDLFTNYRHFWSYLGMSVIYGSLFLLGVAFLVFPAIIVGSMFCLAPYFVLEKGLGSTESLKASYLATKEQRFPLCRWVLFSFLVLTLPVLVFKALELPVSVMNLITQLSLSLIVGLGTVKVYRKLVA